MNNNSSKFDYPLQMADISKNSWRLKSLLDKNLSKQEIEKSENDLWKKIEKIAENSPPPLNTLLDQPKSKLIGYGWEWATYSLPNLKNQVIKVPAGIFPEVNYPEYLKNTIAAHQVCQKFLKPYVARSSFVRKIISSVKTNVIYQEKLSGKHHFYFQPNLLSNKTKKHLVILGKNLLNLLSEQQWMPDLNIEKKENQTTIRNLKIKNGFPKVFDFTYYYDPFRLYPERTKWQVKHCYLTWKKLIKKLSL